MLLGLISFPRCEKTDFGESAFFGILTRFEPSVKSFHDRPYQVSTSRVFLHSVWNQDVLDRTTRITHRPRDVPKVRGKGTNQNSAKAR